MRFNKDMPSGEISPPHNFARYWQNGHYYDAEYNRLDNNGKKIVERYDAPPPPPPEAEEGGSVNTDGVTDESDLIAWAKDEAKMEWFAVKKRMADAGYPDEASNTKAAAIEAIKAKHSIE